MEEKTEEKKEKKVITIKFKTAIILIVITVLICLGIIAWVLFKPNKSDAWLDSWKSSNPYTYNNYSYVPLDDFNKLKEYKSNDPNYFSGVYYGDGENLKSKGLPNEIIINNSADFDKWVYIIGITDMFSSSSHTWDYEEEKYINEYTIGGKFDINDKFWKTNSLILYRYDNDTAVAGMKVTDIRSSNNVVNIDIAVSEGKKIGDDELNEYETFSGGNIKILCILTNKLDDNTKLNFKITKFDAKLVSKECNAAGFSEYKDYVSSDDFNKVDEYYNYPTDIVYIGTNYGSDYVKEYSSIGFEKGVIVNSSKDLKKLTNKCKNMGMDLDSELLPEDNYWKNGSLIIYIYNNNKDVTGIKVTDIKHSDGLLNIDIAVSEGKPIEDSGFLSFFDSSSDAGTAKMLYIFTNKIDYNTKLNFNINRFDAKLIKSSGAILAAKPIIYLYPEEEMEIAVTLGNKEKLTHTYPKYENSWNVLAKPNGDLIDLKTRRNLYSLYWEGINTVLPNMTEGFVVEGSNTIAFLEEKLALLGLTQREANEFIIYWLPQLENNKYNFIRFQTIEEINNNMPLQVSPTPDTIIRVMMEFKPLDEYIEIPEQNIVTPSRDGFVVVEWGRN